MNNWTRESVDATLKAYKAEKGRFLHLSIELSVLGEKKDRALRRALADASAPQAQVITDMPRGGNRVGSKVEDIAVKFADGWMPEELADLNTEIDKIEAEANRCGMVVQYVEAWLSALTERERWIVEHQFINEEIWDNVLTDYQRLFDRGLSRDTLKRIKMRGLERIYQMVGV